MKPLALRLPAPLLLTFVALACLSSCSSAPRTSHAPRGHALRVGVDPAFPPMAFDREGELVGIEPDLARELGERLGRRVVFERFAGDSLLAALEQGKIDVVMSGLAITPERAGRVRFVAPYMESGQLALIRAADLGQFGRIHTIRRAGARVGYQHGTNGERFVASELTRATSFGFDDVDSGLRSLRAGRIDYFIHDAPTVWQIAGDPQQRDLHGLYQRLTQEELAWAVRRNDAALAASLDEVVAAWKQDGGIEKTIDRWIPVRVTIH